jgi:hypothetical protein
MLAIHHRLPLAVAGGDGAPVIAIAITAMTNSVGSHADI